MGLSFRCSFFPRHPVLRSYLIDLLVILSLFLLYFPLQALPPFERIIWRDDRSIMFPMTENELIPTWALPIFAFIIPMIIVTAWLGVNKFRERRLLVVYLGLLLSLLITVQVTALLKPLVGRPRPDFLDRCNPDPSNLVKVVCRGLRKVVREGRKSFPSGHTSSSFAGLGYAGFFLAGQLGVFDGEGHAHRLIISLAPFLLAGFVGITRITDYRHHWQDVIAGGILGIASAYFSYRLYFPSIMQPVADVPLDGRFVKYSEKIDSASGEEGQQLQAGPSIV